MRDGQQEEKGKSLIRGMLQLVEEEKEKEKEEDDR